MSDMETIQAFKEANSWMSIAADFERKLAASEATIRQLREALDGLMQLIENGVLVRDTSRDAGVGWALHQLPLLCTLQKAKAALAGGAQ